MRPTLVQSLPALDPLISQKGGSSENKKVPDKSSTYEFCRYLVPSSLLASQTTKTAAKARKKALKPVPLTYSQLLDAQVVQVDSGKLNRQTAANRATALRAFLQTNNIPANDVVGSEMRIGYLAATERLAKKLRDEGKSDRSISNTRAALKPWRLAVTEDDTARALSSGETTPFKNAVAKIFIGHPVKRVARQAGVSSDMLFGWLHGKMPRASNAKAIRRLEAFFSLEKESLVTLAGIKGDARPREQVGRAPENEYRSTLLARTSQKFYLVPPSASPLRAQWRALLEYKTALVPDLMRSGNSRWTFAPVAVRQQTASNWPWFLNGVEVPSASPGWAAVGSYLGWMALPKSAGGLGIAADELQTLAWFAVPGHIEPYLAWCRERAGGRYTRNVMTFLGTVIWLVRPENGYLSQQPQMLDTLPRALHSENWESLCRRQYNYCLRLKQALQPEVVCGRDPFAPMRSILDLPEPMEALADMIQRMRLDRPVGGCPLREAVWARDLFLMKLLASNPLRMRNLATLTWTPMNCNGYHPDNQAALYQRTGGAWWLWVPKPHLKNRRGSSAVRDYDAPVHESVWGDLERYLHRHRSHLLRWPSELVFLRRVRDPKQKVTVRGQLPLKRPATTAHHPNMEMSRQVMALTKKYLWNCDGIGTHAFRHMVATSIIKCDAGTMKIAALVLNDQEATVAKHYAWLQSGDGAERMGELLGKSLNRM